MLFINQIRINRIFPSLSIILLLVSGCGNPHINSGKSENPDLQQALWIGDAREWPVADSLMYGEFPAPVFRKEFTAKKDLKSAKLFITAAGYYSASINSEKAGKNYVDPAWTNFKKRIYYTEYDITNNVREGINCLGVSVGNGFYNPLPMKMWGRYNLRDVLPVGRPVFIAKLKLEYVNGKTEEFISDNTWKYSYGPTIKNNVYLGELYDAGREIPGWKIAGYDDIKWQNAKIYEGPGGKLQKAFFPPVQVTEIVKPVNISSPRKDVYIVDMGVNFTGIYKIRIKGNMGDTVSFRFGERLYENGELNPMTQVAGQIKREGMAGPGSPPLACQADTFIFGDKKDAWYSPEFTFHIYRYMEVTGLSYMPDKDDMEGIAFNSNVKADNSFTCSSDLINSIQKASRRTFLNNLISVQSDCPGRERFGYGGDLNSSCEAFLYNFDMQAFYRKTIYDWVDAVDDSTFKSTAPNVFPGFSNCGISWESGFLITQDKLLLFCNDIEIVKELYDLDLKWMDKVARFYPSGVVTLNNAITDHESLVRSPVELIHTTHYLECARIMKRFATLMNDGQNVKRFSDLAEKINDIMLNMFWRKPVPDPVNRQTLFATLLYYDIIPEKEKNAALDSLFKALASAPSGHFTTGIFGTQYILEVLSRSGHAGSVFDIVNSTAYPGWGHMIDRGATTIWETWKESDNVYSNCHPMFGSVSGWFYGWLGGIRPVPDYPGFERFVISPSIPDGLEWVKCVYHSPFGEIVSSWEKKGSGNMVFEIKIPEGSMALVTLPVKEKQIISVKEKMSNRSFSPDNAGRKYGEFELKPGDYDISVMPGK